jgi:hypothetical protein
MLHPGGASGLDRTPAGNQIHVAEFRRFRRFGMRDSHQLDKAVSGLDLSGVGVAIEGIAEDRLAACWKSFLRAWPHQRLDLVASLQQESNQRAAYVSGSAGNEDTMGSHGGLILRHFGHG